MAHAVGRLRGGLTIMIVSLVDAIANLVKFLILNAIWVPVHLAWLAAGVTLRRLDLPDRAQFAINVAMALAMLAVVALAAIAPH